MSRPVITVAICTLNRRDLARQAVQSVLDDPSADSAEILVIDNGSNDGTEAAIRAMSTEGRPLRVVVEPKQGLSEARNRAADEADTPLVGYLDDDAIVSPGWVGAWAGLFERHPEAAAAGGPIAVALPGIAPRWLTPQGEALLGHLDLGGVERALMRDETPFGGNMVVKRSQLLKLGGFRADLGVAGTSFGACEEEEFFGRLVAGGGTVWYSPVALVTHIIDGRHLTLRWMCRRSMAQGRARALMSATSPNPGSRSSAAGAFSRALFRNKLGTIRKASRGHATKLLFNEVLSTTYFLGYGLESLAAP